MRYYLFECSLNLHSLSPGNSWIGQAVAIVGSPGEVDALFVQVAEGLGHHLHSIVGERRCVLSEDDRIFVREVRIYLPQHIHMINLNSFLIELIYWPSQ